MGQSQEPIQAEGALGANTTTASDIKLHDIPTEHPPEQVRKPKPNREDKTQPSCMGGGRDGEEASTMQTRWPDVFCTPVGTPGRRTRPAKDLLSSAAQGSREPCWGGGGEAPTRDTSHERLWSEQQTAQLRSRETLWRSREVWFCQIRRKKRKCHKVYNQAAED